MDGIGIVSASKYATRKYVFPTPHNVAATPSTSHGNRSRLRTTALKTMYTPGSTHTALLIHLPKKTSTDELPKGQTAWTAKTPSSDVSAVRAPKRRDSPVTRDLSARAFQLLRARPLQRVPQGAARTRNRS